MCRSATASWFCQLAPDQVVVAARACRRLRLARVSEEPDEEERGEADQGAAHIARLDGRGQEHNQADEQPPPGLAFLDLVRGELRFRRDDCLGRGDGHAHARHEHPAQQVGEDAAAEDETEDDKCDAHGHRVDLVALAETGADTGDDGASALVLRDAARARVPHVLKRCR